MTRKTVPITTEAIMRAEKMPIIDHKQAKDIKIKKYE